MVVLKLLVFTTMVLVLAASTTTAWRFTIDRNSTWKLSLSVVDSIDQLNISGCIGSDNICTNFSAQNLLHKCQCICSQDKSTFGYYNNKWGCTENSIVRKHAGCQYAIQRPGSKGEQDPLYTLPVLGGHSDSNYVGNIPSNKNCNVITENATFLKCDGTWGKLTESRVTGKVAFQDKALGKVYVGPYQESSPTDHLLDGRVIRIPIKCDGLTWNSSQCVTFKIKGQIECSSGDVPPIIVPRDTTTTISPTTTNGTGNIKKSEGNEPTPAVAVIAGSVVGGILFIILIVAIIILVIWWKRRKTKVKKKSQRAQDNLAYEQGPDFSLTLTSSTNPRPLPAPPSPFVYENLKRDPSIKMQNHPNETNSGSRDQDYNQCNGEPLYGEIDDTYSRLDHQLLQQTRPKSNEVTFPNGLHSPEVPNKSGSLISNDRNRSGLFGFEEYDVVGGQIKSSLPRENTLRSSASNSLGRESNSPYDVPESMIRSSSKERPQSGIQDDVTLPSNDVNHPTQRDSREAYETVWDDNNDDLVARIDLS